MANLPKDCLTPNHPQFIYVGVGYFGPFQIRYGRRLVKKYGVVFMRLAIRAVGSTTIPSQTKTSKRNRI